MLMTIYVHACACTLLKTISHLPGSWCQGSSTWSTKGSGSRRRSSVAEKCTVLVLIKWWVWGCWRWQLGPWFSSPRHTQMIWLNWATGRLWNPWRFPLQIENSFRHRAVSNSRRSQDDEPNCSCLGGKDNPSKHTWDTLACIIFILPLCCCLYQWSAQLHSSTSNCLLYQRVLLPFLEMLHLIPTDPSGHIFT